MRESVRRSTRVSARQSSASPAKGRKRKSTVSEETPAKRSSVPSSSVEDLLKPVEIPKIQKKVVKGQIVDSFCWICHTIRDGTEKVCNLCLRIYHNDCITKKKLSSESFCECKQMSLDGCSIHFKTNELREMLRLSIQEASKEKKKTSQRNQRVDNNIFVKLFLKWPFHARNEELREIVDLEILLDKIKDTPPYHSTNQFYLDVKVIHHNCCIVFGESHKTTEVALQLVKNIHMELLDIEACQECYQRKHSTISSDSYFTEVCRKPHSIVWAKLRGSPHWPAKCLKVRNNQADVRFFGTHDKSVISCNHLLQISKLHPNGKSLREMPKLKEAAAELYEYIANYESTIGPFIYHEKQKQKEKEAEETNSVENPEVIPPIPCDGMKVKNLVNKPKDSKKPAVLGAKPADIVDTKIKATLHSSLDSESLQDNVEMTFTADIEEATDEITDDDDVKHFSQQYSIGDNSHVNELSVYQTSLQSSVSPSIDAHLLPPCTETDISTGAYINEDFQNSSSMPVIACTHSRDEAENFLNMSDSNEILHSTPIISSPYDNIASFPTEPNVNNFVTDTGNGILQDFDVDDDADLQVVAEKVGGPPLNDVYKKTDDMLQTFCQLLLHGKTPARETFNWFQKMSSRIFLTLYLRMNSGKTAITDFDNLSQIYKYFLKSQDVLKLQNSKLQAVVNKQKERIVELEQNKIDKLKLKEEIVKASQSVFYRDKEAYEKDIDNLTDEIRVKDSKMEEYVKMIESSMKEIESLKDEIKFKNTTIAELSVHLQEQNRNMKSDECAITEPGNSPQEFDEAKQELEKTKQELNETKDELYRTKHKYDELKEKVARQEIDYQDVTTVEVASSYRSEEISQQNNVIIIQQASTTSTSSSFQNVQVPCERSVTSECSLVGSISSPILTLHVPMLPGDMMQSTNTPFLNPEISEEILKKNNLPQANGREISSENPSHSVMHDIVAELKTSAKAKKKNQNKRPLYSSKMK